MKTNLTQSKTYPLRMKRGEDGRDEVPPGEVLEALQ
jgi:hypothetical protein